jgi:hypothetical protein
MTNIRAFANAINLNALNVSAMLPVTLGFSLDEAPHSKRFVDECMCSFVDYDRRMEQWGRNAR